MRGKQSIRAVVDLDVINGIPLDNGIHHILTLGHFTKNSVLTVKMRGRTMGNKKLGSIGVRSGIRHGENPCLVMLQVRLTLTLKLISRSSHSGAGWVSPLNHKVRDYTVKCETVVKPTARKVEKTRTGHRSISRKHADFYRPLIRIHCNVDVLDIAHVAERKNMNRRQLHAYFLSLLEYFTREPRRTYMTRSLTYCLAILFFSLPITPVMGENPSPNPKTLTPKLAQQLIADIQRLPQYKVRILKIDLGSYQEGALIHPLGARVTYISPKRKYEKLSHNFNHELRHVMFKWSLTYGWHTECQRMDTHGIYLEVSSETQGRTILR